MMTCADDRHYASDVIGLLWPQPWELRAGRGAGPSPRQRGVARTWYVFPHRRRPRLLVPTDVPEAAGMLTRLGRGGTRGARGARNALARAARTPAFRLLPWPVVSVLAPGGVAAASMESYLSGHLGTQIRLGVLLGTRRANQKPVLQVFDLDGEVLGYAKVGHNELTAQLVRREARALAELARHPTASFRIPRILHSARWRGLEVLVMSPLSGKSLVPDDRRVEAMRELAYLNGTVEQVLGESGYWHRLGSRLGRIRDDAVRNRLQRCRETIAARWGATPIELGGWHGDWGDWNSAVSERALSLWDWERYDAEVPMGFDGVHHRAQQVRPVHHRAQQVRREALQVADQERLFLEAVPGVLRRLGVPPERADLTLALYLLEISTRYGLAGNHPAGELVRQRNLWGMDLLERLLGFPSLLGHLEGGRP